MSRLVKLILCLSIFMLFVSNASALYFDVFLEPVKDRIFLDEMAYYNVTIYNFAPIDEDYEISTPDISWRTSVSPLNTKVPAESSKSFLITADPLTYVTVGAHMVGIKVKAESTKEYVIEGMPIYIKATESDIRTYEPSLELSVDMDSKLDTREVVLLEINVRNRNALDIDNLTVRVQSNLINKEYSMPFSGLQEKTDIFLFNLSPAEKPQKDTLIVTLLLGDKIINQVVKPFEIVSYADIIVNEKDESSFLKKKYTVEIYNDGNVNKPTIYKKETSLLGKIITFTDPKYDKIVKEGNKRYLIWNFNLNPQEKTSIGLSVQYGIFVYPVVFFLLFLFLYFVLRSPIVVRKEASVIGSQEEGLTELKVVLHLKNRSQKVIENVRITEKTPRLVRFEKDSYVGTLAPEKIIEHNKLGTTVRWYLKSLEPFEERIITYKIKSKLTIIGGFTLPRVIVRFDTSQGRERVTYSNTWKIRL
jgi:hypothetical protein